MATSPLGFLIAGLAALALASCTPANPPPGQNSQDQAAATASESVLDTLRAEIRDAAADPVCKDVAQCRAIAFGAKPCGGPWTYLVYSVVATDSADLAHRVGNYNREEDNLNRTEERVSDCMLVTPPTLTCAQGRCVGDTR